MRCSRCQHTFLVAPPSVTKEEILEDVTSCAQCHGALIEPNQNKVEFFPLVKSDSIIKAEEDEETLSVDQETIAKNEGRMVPEKPVRLDRIKVKTFKIDRNSFSIEWNIQER